MKKSIFFFIIIFCAAMATSCNSEETYADKKDKERTAISQFISDSSIVVISEDQFAEQGYTTDVERNEYVLFESSGVYMQIVNGGCGSVISNGKTEKVLMRYKEYDIENDYYNVDFLSSNSYYTPYYLDQMYVSNTSGTYSASYQAYSLCWTYATESSTTVPTGFLVPMKYVKIGRPSSADEDVARVKMIIPHSAGRATNTNYVYPCYYEATYELGL